MAHKTIRSSKLKKKRRKVFFLKMTLFFLVIFGFVGGLLYGLHTKRFEIQEVEVIGAQKTLNQGVEEHARKVLAGSYFGVLPKENIFLYPKRGLEQEVLESFPRLQKISLELDPFKKQVLRIDVSERREVGVWCRNVGEEQECFFIDKEGYVFALAPVYSDGVVFVYSGGIETDTPLGEYFVEPNTFSQLNTFVRAIQSSPELESLNPVGLESLPGDEYKLYLTGGAYILFNNSYGFPSAYDNLRVVVQKEGVDISTLEYIDIRIPNKVFYKTL